MNNKSNIFFLFVLMTAIFFSCKKEDTYTFSTPSTYRFNSPSLVERNVYLINGNDYTLLIDSLGSFDKSNAEIADTLNVFIKQNFIDPFITELMLIDGSNLKMVISNYDTLSKKFVTIKEENLGYSLVGNDLEINGYPELSINIDTDFMELRQCKLFSERSVKNAPQNLYIEENCTTRDGEKTVDKIVKSDLSVTFDTISVEYVDFIYSKY